GTRYRARDEVCRAWGVGAVCEGAVRRHLFEAEGAHLPIQGAPRLGVGVGIQRG
ncbi:unnamed protein product, partial [Ascophyllum nodosum]